NAQALSLMGSLLRAGVAPQEAVKLALPLMNQNPAGSMIRLIKDDLEKGLGLTVAMKRASFLTPFHVRLLERAEERGDLADTLTSLGELYNERFERARMTAMALFEPMMIMGIGLCLLPVLIQLYFSVFSVGRYITF